MSSMRDSVCARQEAAFAMRLCRVSFVWRAGFAGSRSGALISTAWASMIHQGEEGYLRITDQMMKVHFFTSRVCPPVL